ncbi:MAG: hypothetical protein IPP74_08455 [Alphaproteobacteria bacterium]|nr:hypothetical protein [Alphaproteobacteria bacterium]
MKFNKIFYYAQKLEDEQFNANPPEEIDVNRLIQKEPYYRNISESDVFKPKTLIISDWTANQWYLWEKRHARRVLEQWMAQDGGQVLYWRMCSLVPLTRESLYKLRKHTVYPYSLDALNSIKAKLFLLY